MYYEQCNEEIVLKVTQDQRQQLAKFYAQVEQRAYRMAMIETRNSSDALDLVQDAMESLMKRYISRPSQEWRPLFYTILHNRIKDWHRWTGLRTKLHWSNSDIQDSLVEQPQLVSSELSPSQKTQQDFAMQSLQDALKKLSLRQRQAVLLRIWEGFSVQETAGIMKCSQGSVKTHLSRALSSLNSQLDVEL